MNDLSNWVHRKIFHILSIALLDTVVHTLAGYIVRINSMLTVVFNTNWLANTQYQMPCEIHIYIYIDIRLVNIYIYIYIYIYINIYVCVCVYIYIYIYIYICLNSADTKSMVLDDCHFQYIDISLLLLPSVKCYLERRWPLLSNHHLKRYHSSLIGHRKCPWLELIE